LSVVSGIIFVSKTPIFLWHLQLTHTPKIIEVQRATPKILYNFDITNISQEPEPCFLESDDVIFQLSWIECSLRYNICIENTNISEAPATLTLNPKIIQVQRATPKILHNFDIINISQEPEPCILESDYVISQSLSWIECSLRYNICIENTNNSEAQATYTQTQNYSGSASYSENPA